MNPRYSPDYLHRLFSSDAYEDLAQISSLLCATERFSQTASAYGLPQPLFVFVEGLLWAAQSWRSGAWTYYEATPRIRQEAMCLRLEVMTELALARCYAEGMKNWPDEHAMRAIDEWIQQHETDVTRSLRNLVRANRSTIEELLS